MKPIWIVRRTLIESIAVEAYSESDAEAIALDHPCAWTVLVNQLSVQPQEVPHG